MTAGLWFEPAVIETGNHDPNITAGWPLIADSSHKPTVRGLNALSLPVRKQPRQ